MDRTGDPGYYMRLLKGASGIEWIRQMKSRTYELMKVRPGDHVLDIGCGMREGEEA